MNKRKSNARCVLCLAAASLVPLIGCSLADAAADGVFSVVSGTVAQVLADILGLAIGA